MTIAPSSARSPPNLPGTHSGAGGGKSKTNQGTEITLRILSTLALATLLTATAASAQTAPSIAGKWKTDDANAIILVAPCTPGAATMCGWFNRFLAPEPPGGRFDAKNPDKALRGRKLVGVPILIGLRPEGGQWVGRGYSPKEGRNFNAKVQFKNGKLEMRGCVSIICRTVVWTRA